MPTKSPCRQSHDVKNDWGALGGKPPEPTESFFLFRSPSRVARIEVRAADYDGIPISFAVAQLHPAL